MKKDSLTAQVSLQLKKQRSERGLSLDKLSAKCGVSKAMLGQIERQESSPTIATLWKIATALNCSFSSFIASASPVSQSRAMAHNDLSNNDLTPHDLKHKAVLKQEDNLNSQAFVNDPNMQVKTLFPFSPVTGFEMFEVTLKEYHQQISSAHQSGVVECIHVTRGTLGILSDEAWQTVNEDEQFVLKADQNHGYKAISQTAVFIVVIHYPAL